MELETLGDMRADRAGDFRRLLLAGSMLLALIGLAGCGGTGDEGTSRRVALPKSETVSAQTLPDDHPTTMPPKRIATH